MSFYLSLTGVVLTKTVTTTDQRTSSHIDHNQFKDRVWKSCVPRVCSLSCRMTVYIRIDFQSNQIISQWKRLYCI